MNKTVSHALPHKKEEDKLQIKHCPFCGREPKQSTGRKIGAPIGHADDIYVSCPTMGCPCNKDWYRLEIWQKRPVEKGYADQAFKAKLEWDVARLGIEKAKKILESIVDDS